MADTAKKGITVKVDAQLHAEVSAYVKEHGMTMSEFVSVALYNELHPNITENEENKMEKTRTVAFQVPESLFQRIKDYLQRNNMTQKQFLLGLIEKELDREQTAVESERADFEGKSEQDEDVPENEENSTVSDFETVLKEGETEDSGGEDESEFEGEDNTSDEEYEEEAEENTSDEEYEEEAEDITSDDEYEDEVFIEDCEDEAVQTSTPDSAVRKKKQPVSSGSSQGGIYISRNSENGENYHKLGITVSKSTDCTYDESSDTYSYLTGKPAQINISLSNQNSADEYRFARVYFKFGDTKGNIGQDVGTFRLYTEYSSYDVELKETDQDGLYYYDFSPVNIGDALSYTDEPLFPNMSSGGGSLEVWGELAKQKSDFDGDDVLKTSDNLSCKWLTTPNEPSYSSNSAISAEFIGNGSSDKKIYAPEIYCDTKLNFPYSANASGVNFAKDYQFSIIIEPSDDLQFKPDIINGIKNDNWSVSGIIDGKDGKRVLLDLSGRQWELCRFEVNENYSFRDFNISSVDILDEETVPKIKINGVITNPEFNSWGGYADKEIAVNFKFKLANQSIYTDLTADNAEVTTPETTASKVTFHSTGTLHYEFGGTKEFSSERETKIYVSAAEAKLTHINDGDPYTGDTFTASAVIENSGTLPLTSAKTLSMQCGKEYYLEPESIQKMFNEDTDKTLSIRINAIDFYDVEEKTVTDMNGNSVKTDYRNNDKNAAYEYVTDYTVTAEPKVRDMQCVINWDDSKDYLRATFTKEGIVPATYYIGKSQEFTTIQELFQYLGALKSTGSSEYNYFCTWDLQNQGYKLYSGDKTTYKMYVTVNDSFFNIDRDTAKSSTYSTQSEYISSTLYVDDDIISKWGDVINWQDSLTNPKMTITASDGQTVSDGTEFKEYKPLSPNTVISITQTSHTHHKPKTMELSQNSGYNHGKVQIVPKEWMRYSGKREQKPVQREESCSSVK